MLIPLLLEESTRGLAEGKNPSHILADFFDTHTSLRTEKERIDFMFRVVQYVERQVVLYDSVEDAAFNELHAENIQMSIADYLKTGFFLTPVGSISFISSPPRIP